jgi:hydrogenase maturation protease
MDESVSAASAGKERALVVGIGNELRGDDAAGLEIARRVRAANVAGITVQESGGDISALVDAWEGFDRVILADAVSCAGEPGEVLQLDGRASELQSSVFNRPVSSHGIGVVEAIQLAKELRRLPPSLTIYGVVGSDFRLGEKISADVKRGIDAAACAIICELI